MRIIPVLDVMNGQVVRAVRGRRDEYRPVRSRLTNSTEPSTVARALLAATNAAELYVADLDAIRSGDLSGAVIELIGRVPATILLDSGGASISTRRTDHDLRAILPLEADLTPTQVQERVRSAPPKPGPIFSIDMMGGKLLGPWQNWGLRHNRDVLSLADRVFAMGVRSFIVLDLAAVGTSEGVATCQSCAMLRERYPEVEIISGGGTRCRADLEQLAEAGADAALVASALHDGSLLG